MKKPTKSKESSIMTHNVAKCNDCKRIESGFFFCSGKCASKKDGLPLFVLSTEKK